MRTHPLQLILLLVGVALAFVMPFEKPVIPKKHKKRGAPAAAVPSVGGVWSNARFLDEHLARAVDQVPQATGAAFLAAPSVRASTVDTVAGILREDYDAVFRHMKAEDDAAIAAMSRVYANRVIAVYEPGESGNVIHVIPANAVRAAEAAGDESLTSEAVLRLLLVRMAVIAQDRQLHPEWKTALDAAGNIDALNAAGAVLQGHAQYQTERVAKAWGLSGDFDKLVTLLLTPGPKGTPPYVEDGVKFAILKGHSFIKTVAKKRGPKGGRGGILKLFAEPPKSSTSILDPTAYVGGTKKLTSANLQENIIKEFAVLTPAEDWTSAAQPLEKAAADTMLEPIPAQHTAAVRAAFKSGTTWIADKKEDGSRTIVTLIEMNSEGMAEAFIGITKGAAKKRGAEITDGAGRDSGLAGYVATIAKEADGKKREQTGQWTFEGRYVLGLTTTDPAADRDQQDDALEAAAEVLAKSQKTRKRRGGK